MKVALAQLDVKAGRPKQNVTRMLQMIDEAKNNGADLIAFPEMAVGGYMVGDKWTDENWCINLIKHHKALVESAKDIVVIFGSIYSSLSKGHDGRSQKFNAAYVCQNQEIKNVRFKSLLPNYRIFDDERYFTSALDDLHYNQSPIEINGTKIGLEICEDMWHEDYPVNITKKLINEGAEFIINISCSPWTYGKEGARDRVIQRMKKNLNDKFVSFYYTNACGVQNNGKNIITFDGGSRAYNDKGIKLPNHLDDYEEGILYFNDGMCTPCPLATLSFAINKNKIEEKFDAIIRAYKGLDEMMEWKPNYVFGLSGGVDSSLSATLAVLALGKDRVKGFNLPSQYNSDKTKDAAEVLANNLGISYEVIPINKMVDANINTLMSKEITSIAEENIQAKIRGTSIMSNLTAMYNGVMTNNGNKLEIALGYATLYGDFNGVFAPLGDLTKAEVFEMCRFINEKFGNLIPTEMLPINDLYDFPEDGIAPSAELKEEQLDPMKFGYHDRMIEMVMDFKKNGIEDFAMAYKNGQLSTFMGIKEELITKYNLDNPKVFIEDLEWFFKAIQKSVFKRIQAPPIVLLSKTAYGYDYRESQFAFETSLAYEALKAEVLK